MNYFEFRNKFFELGVFGVNQVLAWYPSFQRNNLSRWIERGLIIRLRQGYYAFPEYLREPGFAYFISNYMYKPSYVSTYTALAFYGMIPEAVTHITAVATLKTANFNNAFGIFPYRKIKKDYFFGYEKKLFGARSILIATPEKALLDLLYLSPQYDTETAFVNLRLDSDFMHSELDEARLFEYARRMGGVRLSERVKMMRKVYD